jgi:hypothetical protein
VGPGAPRCVVPTKVPVPPCGAPARLATGDPSPGDQPEQYSSRAHPGAHSAARHLAPVRGGKKDHSISWATPHATNNHIADGKPCLCLLLCFALHRHNPCQLTQMTPLHGPLPCKACLAGTLSHIEFPTRPLFLSPLCTTPEPPSLSYSLTCPSVVSRSVIRMLISRSEVPPRSVCSDLFRVKTSRFIVTHVSPTLRPEARYNRIGA